MGCNLTSNQPWLQESMKWWPRWRLGWFCHGRPFCDTNRFISFTDCSLKWKLLNFSSFRPVISQQFNSMQGYSLKNMHYQCVHNYCMIILSPITRTILTFSSNPEPHLHNENGLQALNDLTNIMRPCVSAGDTPQDDESGHANAAIAEIFSCSTVHSLRDKLWTLPLLLKLSHCSILSHIYKSVCMPTMKQTGDSCIAMVPGRGREQREKQSGSRNGPLWATARDLEWVPNCRAASGKGHNQENKSVQQRGKWVSCRKLQS